MAFVVFVADEFDNVDDEQPLARERVAPTSKWIALCQSLRLRYSKRQTVFRLSELDRSQRPAAN